MSDAERIIPELALAFPIDLGSSLPTGAAKQAVAVLGRRIANDLYRPGEIMPTELELADSLGVHYQTVGYLERGEFRPSLHLALRIAEYFEVPVEVVFSLQPFPRLGADVADNGRRSA